MDRLRFFIFKSVPVHCFNCKHEGPSRLVPSHQLSFLAMTLVALLLTWLTGYLPGANLLPAPPVRLGSYFGAQYTPYMLAVWWLVALSMLFSMKGHRCSNCGSEYLRHRD